MELACRWLRWHSRRLLLRKRFARAVEIRSSPETGMLHLPSVVGWRTLSSPRNDGMRTSRKFRSPFRRLARLSWKRQGSPALRSEEHTSELQSLMRISYAVFCLKKNNNRLKNHTEQHKA